MISKKDISFIQPSRNNLRYLKWSYDSIRKNGGPEPTICVADDFSNDGTWEWCEDMMEKDPNFKAIRNEGPKRLGHTILYDELVEIADTPIIGIYHADMYLCPGALESVLEHIKPKHVVSLTRIEPPLHPDGPEKILLDFGIEPEEFEKLEKTLLNKIPSLKQGKTTEGIFAPWFMFKEDFTSIGGHDPLFAPQSKEDTDIFNRFHLNGYKFVQTWDGFVYHMTCRGSRFADGAKRNPNGEVFMKNRETDEWLTQNNRSTRNFIRKWGHYCKHDTLMKPIVPPKYDIGFRVANVNEKILNMLEPWCNNISVETGMTDELINEYIKSEQPDTEFNIADKINNIVGNDIIVKFDANKLTQYSYQLITELSSILESSEIDIGEFELDIFKFNVNRLETYENELIKLN
jgi:glycosyltransferase involved in cell wall biosynthesis|tara:strand:- start:1528 stop:2739 length:1212 start_codon:yes stop_codon:yes gene_type:complete